MHPLRLVINDEFLERVGIDFPRCQYINITQILKIEFRLY
jgi:hypothetical protein